MSDIFGVNDQDGSVPEEAVNVHYQPLQPMMAADQGPVRQQTWS